MQQAKPIRMGVVGCGSVMQSYMALAEKLRCQDRLEVVMACDVVEARRNYMRQTYGIERLTGNYSEVLAADDVELVLILTSMCEHGPIARAALAAGKHVLVEKPMAVTPRRQRPKSSRWPRRVEVTCCAHPTSS